MRDHLWLKNPRPPAPWEYIEFQMCRVYGCTPSQLRRESVEDIFDHLHCLEGEAIVAKKEAETASRR